MFEAVWKKILNRPSNSHKYDYGHVLIFSGSPGMVGAPPLVGKAALRIGAGLVTIASAPDVVDKLEKRVEEIMTLRVKETSDLVEFIKDRKVNSLVIGPGLKPEAERLVLEILAITDLPSVIDGGALTILSKNNNLSSLQRKLNLLSKNWALTPHSGEFQRFFQYRLPKDQTSLRPIAKKFAREHQLNLVLKGHPTLVAGPNVEVYINKTGGPGLATAGSGDVLSGMIAGLLAQGIELAEAAKAGVYLHGLAGDLATKTKTEAGLIASDIVEAIPAALRAANN